LKTSASSRRFSANRCRSADYSQAELVQITSEEAQKVANKGLSHIDSLMSPAQKAAILSNPDKPWLRWYYRGSVVHNETFHALQSRFGSWIQYASNKGIDFTFGNGLQVELTTIGSVGSHVRRGIPKNLIATYKWVK
jgi:hypothetical protein